MDSANNRGTPLNDITNQMKMVVDENVAEKTVTKRNGETQTFAINKIKARLEALLEGLASKHINLDLVMTKTIQ